LLALREHQNGNWSGHALSHFAVHLADDRPCGPRPSLRAATLGDCALSSACDGGAADWPGHEHLLLSFFPAASLDQLLLAARCDAVHDGTSDLRGSDGGVAPLRLQLGY